MIKLWTRIFPFAVLSSVYNTRYFVSGALNDSCIPNDVSCSVCCAKQECTTNMFYPNACKNGCIDGHRGARCYELCNYNCKNCDDNINECKSCFDGFYPGVNKDCTAKCQPTCKECSNGYSCISCKEGFYNKDGSSDCRYRLCPVNCECSNGECAACKEGFYEINTNCNSKCPINCKNCSADSHCSLCKDGFFNDNKEPSTCIFSCRDNCTTCSSYDECSRCKLGTFGKQCNNICSTGCRNNECMITGKCECLNNFFGERCTECKSGWFGISCDMTCPYYCNNSECGKVFGYCTQGCNSNTITGSFCDTCVTGKYGPSCNINCPENCFKDICFKENGTCTEGCKVGFDGPFCLECVQGKYGNECKEDCPDKCKDNECLKLSGHCLNCAGNFHGNICDKCNPGFYGADCENICSSKCFNVSCIKDSGKCINGCKDAYYGDKCCGNNKNCLLCESNSICQKCSPGYFGKTCNETCSDLCINNVCELRTGVCSQGCTSTTDKSICILSYDNKEQDSKESDSKDTTIAILATLFAVSTLALCLLVSAILIRHFIPTKRKHKESKDVDRPSTEMHNLSKRGVFGEENIPYETLDGTRLSFDDHTYESANVHGIEHNNTQTYVNM